MISEGTGLMPTLARASRAPLGTIKIDSALPPGDVIENLRLRGKEWRESAVPADLRKFKVMSLGVTVEDSRFEMAWLGDISPFYKQKRRADAHAIDRGADERRPTAG